jgi:hypothetical protein
MESIASADGRIGWSPPWSMITGTAMQQSRDLIVGIGRYGALRNPAV